MLNNQTKSMSGNSANKQISEAKDSEEELTMTHGGMLEPTLQDLNTHPVSSFDKQDNTGGLINMQTHRDSRLDFDEAGKVLTLVGFHNDDRKAMEAENLIKNEAG